MKRVSRRAWYLDVAFSMCGWRLGWSSLIGVIPLLGDIMNVCLSLQVIKLAHQVDSGLPPAVLAQMVGNIVIDFVLGITPIVGTIVGAIYKANSRNSLVLEHFLKERANQNLAAGKHLSKSTNGDSRSAWPSSSNEPEAWVKPVSASGSDLVIDSSSPPKRVLEADIPLGTIDRPSDLSYSTGRNPGFSHAGLHDKPANKRD